MSNRRQIFIGYDRREAAAFAVARTSIREWLAEPIPICSIRLDDVRQRRLYKRATYIKGPKNILFDYISGAPMATEFALSRFLVPHIQTGGLAVSMDCDMLARANMARLFEMADPSKAVMVVKHEQRVTSAWKMDDQPQSSYPRKNWSSLILWNLDHPAHARLTLELFNTAPGLDLHRFCWLEDDEIGALPVEWNWLAGHSDLALNPHIVHFTDGTPDIPGYENAPYADEWREVLTHWTR